jgi:acyl-ACP thioesterase
MVELVVLACLLKDPQHCESFHVPFQQDIQAVQCVWQSQMQAAQWSGEHPDWVIRRVSCEMPRT